MAEKKSKAGRKRNKIQIEKDRREIAGYYLKGWGQYQIAEAMGYTQQQISYDLKAIREAWKQEMIGDFSEAKAKQLMKIDALEAEFWDQYQESKKRHDEDGTVFVGTNGEPLRLTGNPKFMEGILSCIKERNKVLGIYDDPGTDKKPLVVKWINAALTEAL